MFCIRTYCALIIMIELAHNYVESDADMSGIAQKRNLTTDAFYGIIEQLKKSCYISQWSNNLYLHSSPYEISIWDIIQSVDNGDMCRFEPIECSGMHCSQRSAITMINEEMGAIEQMIQYRLKRHKLSSWSERVHKTIYIGQLNG